MYFFDGLLDEVRIYNRALKANDVAKLYNYESDKTNLLVNGGFEQPNVATKASKPSDAWITYGTSYSVNGPQNGLFGWQVVSGEVDVMSNTVANSRPPEGMQFLDLDGRMLGAIKQSIATTVGQTYLFSFKHQKYAYGLNYNSSLRAEVLSANNTQLVNSTVSITPTPVVPWEWVEFKTEFTATSNSTTIKFTSLNPGGSVSGVQIDDVRVSAKNYSEMVTVQGGTLPAGSGLAGQQVSTFQIGKYEVTWGEWKAVRDWAVANGYTDLAGVGQGSGETHPVQNVSWYDVIKWCNAKSEMEGLTPVYQVGLSTYKTGLSNSTYSSAASGYRLPSEKEWEWAARGGVSSQGYIYSGSNDVNAVAWYADNSPAVTKPVGAKAANELGIHDMSGNVREWYFNADGNFKDADRGPNLPAGYFRLYRGGGVTGVAGTVTVTHRWDFAQPFGSAIALGFRLAACRT